MNFVRNAIAQLASERDRLNGAIKALADLDNFRVHFTESDTQPVIANKPAKKRTVSAASRAKMRAAQKARWARIKAAAKPKLIKGKVA